MDRMVGDGAMVTCARSLHTFLSGISERSNAGSFVFRAILAVPQPVLRTICVGGRLRIDVEVAAKNCILRYGNNMLCWSSLLSAQMVGQRKFK